MNDQSIKTRLTEAFSPIELVVMDDSHKHAHHKGTPHTQNTHFDVTIVSDAFTGMPLVARHRRIHHALADAFSGTLHALKISAYSPSEWSKKTAE